MKLTQLIETTKTINIDYQANYNGCYVTNEDGTEDAQTQACADLITNRLIADCEEDGEYGYDDNRARSKIEQAVHEIYGADVLAKITIDRVST